MSESRETWKTILIFLVTVIALSSIFHYDIVNLYPSRIYIGGLMWCPELASIITLKIKGRPISSLNWAEELGLVGIGTLNTTSTVIIAAILLGTVEVIRLSTKTLGEETGWRGLFIYELKKVLSFIGVTLFSGIVWVTYLTFKSKSLWPAVIFHAVSNVYMEKILPELTIQNEGAEDWLGEYGIMSAIVTSILGIYFWRKAIKENV